MRNGIKESFDVQIYDPVENPASLPRHTYRVQCRAAGTVDIGVRMEDRFHHRLQHHLYDRLRHAIGDRRNAERPRAASVLLYLDKPHGRREVRARRHPIPDLVKVALQILLECSQRHAIHARSTSVRLDPLVGFPDELLRNVIRLCVRHRFLPSLVGQRPPLESRVPLLCPHYQASSLVLTRPSLRLALVLCSSWVYHLEVSLSIKAQVPTFHTRASRWSHAVFMPVATRTVGRHPPSSIPGQQLEPGFDDIPTLSTRQQRFTRVRLTSRHLTDLLPPFPQRSLPQPLCRSSLRWFEP